MRVLIDDNERPENSLRRFLICGNTWSDSRSDVKSRGDTEPVSIRPTIRSKS